MREGIEELFSISTECGDFLIECIAHTVFALHRETRREVHEDLDIIFIDMCDILVDELCLIEGMISFIELTEDDIEFSVYLGEGESFDDEGSSFDDMSSCDESSDTTRDIDEFFSILGRDLRERFLLRGFLSSEIFRNLCICF